MVLLEGIELSTSPLPKQWFSLLKSENRENGLLGMEDSAGSPQVNGTTGPALPLAQVTRWTARASW